MEKSANSALSDRAIAFLGLGVMGYPMAKHWALTLAQDNKVADIRVYNRTFERAQSWLEDIRKTGGIGSRASLSAPKTVSEAVTGCDVVATCLGGDPDLRAVYFDQGLIDSLAPGSLIIDHTTASAEIAREIHAAAGSRGIGFMDAPVSGGQIGAEKGILSIMVGGEESDFARGLPHMQTYGRNVVHIGKSGSGQTAKMVNQICIAGLLQGLAEGLAFGKKAGLDMEKVLSVITQGAAGSWQMEQRSPTMLAGKYDFGFAVKWMIKDLSIALEEAERVGADCHVASLIKERYEKIRKMGGESFDTSSLMLLTDIKR